jgi:2'-5' RNA ligase
MLTNVYQTRNHWWWRPGWHIGQRCYTWHLIFPASPELHALAAAYQQALADEPAIDLIPHEWLHLTMQTVGFTSEVPAMDADRIVDAVQKRLAQIPAPMLTFHRPVVIAEAIVLPPEPADPVHDIRNAIRAGIADVWGADQVPDRADGFWAHVSLAYLNASVPAAPVIDRVASIDPAPAAAPIRNASLIILGRDEHVYRWTTYATAPLDGTTTSSPVAGA